MTHRFQPCLDMDDEWFIVDTDDHSRTARTFPRDKALAFCFELERDPMWKPEIATWEVWR